MFNPHIGLPPANRRQGAVPVRRRGRRGQGLEPRAGHDRRRRQGPLRPGGDLQGPRRRGHRGGPRLYAADFHNARIDVFDGSFGLVPDAGSRPGLPTGLRPVQRPDDRSPGLRRVREAGRGRRGRGSPVQGRGFVDVYPTRPGNRAGSRGATRPAERAVGPRARSGRASGASAATCLSATSATGRSTPTRSCSNGHFALAAASRQRWQPARDRRALGPPLRERQRGWIVQDALLHGRA